MNVFCVLRPCYSPFNTPMRCGPRQNHDRPESGKVFSIPHRRGGVAGRWLVPSVKEATIRRPAFVVFAPAGDG